MTLMPMDKSIASFAPAKRHVQVDMSHLRQVIDDYNSQITVLKQDQYKAISEIDKLKLENVQLLKDLQKMKTTNKEAKHKRKKEIQKAIEKNEMKLKLAYQMELDNYKRMLEQKDYELKTIKDEKAREKEAKLAQMEVKEKYVREQQDAFIMFSNKAHDARITDENIKNISRIGERS
jgi:regulator of replication initiation timing